VLPFHHGAQGRELIGSIGDNMNGHEWLVSFLPAAIKETYSPGNFEALKSPSSEEAFEIGADFVRQIFGYFDFDFCVNGMHLEYSG
jgi:hypothetical protein